MKFSLLEITFIFCIFNEGFKHTSFKKSNEYDTKNTKNFVGLGNA